MQSFAVNRESTLAFVYYAVVFILVTIGASTGSESFVTLFVLPIGVLATVFQRFAHKQPIKDLGFRTCKLKQAGKAFLLPVAIILFVFLVDWALDLITLFPLSEIPNPWDPGQTGVKPLDLILLILFSTLTTFVGSLLTEELAFRGYLMTRFMKWGDFRAMMLSAFMFGLWHLP